MHGALNFPLQGLWSCYGIQREFESVPSRNVQVCRRGKCRGPQELPTQTLPQGVENLPEGTAFCWSLLLSYCLVVNGLRSATHILGRACIISLITVGLAGQNLWCQIPSSTWPDCESRPSPVPMILPAKKYCLMLHRGLLMRLSELEREAGHHDWHNWYTLKYLLYLWNLEARGQDPLREGSFPSREPQAHPGPGGQTLGLEMPSAVSSSFWKGKWYTSQLGLRKLYLQFQAPL